MLYPRLDRQRGLTLLEVLVGFVIFTTSLVAVLDYVGGQIYHVHRSNANLERLEQLYLRETASRTPAAVASIADGNSSNIEWIVSISELAELEHKDAVSVLNRYHYSTAGDRGRFEWTIIRHERVD